MPLCYLSLRQNSYHTGGISTLNAQDTLAIAIETAKGAGDILMQHFRRPLAMDAKSDVVDIVTEADHASEKFTVGALTKHFPTHHIVGEEGGGMGAPYDTAQAFWYVDPLDGTINFANGIPHFCVSLGLTLSQPHDPILGVIYNPNTGECFTSIKGEGAFLNGERICVGARTELVQSVLVSGFGYDRRTNPDNNLAQWNAFMPKVRGIRRFGSAALDLAFVACGRFDGYWERGLKAWDAVAGLLLVREAGGIVTDYHGNPALSFVPEGRLIAANPTLHSIMHGIINASYRQD